MVGTASHSLEKNIASLRSYAARLTSNRPEADDLLNETIARYLAADGAEQAIENECAWLCVIMKNTWINALRARRPTAPSPDEYSGEVVGEWYVDSLTAQCDMRRAIDSLPQKFQDVIRAHVAEDGSQERVGRRLGISGVTAWTRLQKARRVLRSRLESNDA